MLSRVANNLYWMGRYLERAENTTRLLLVTDDLTTETGGFHSALTAGAWQELFTIFPGAELVKGRWRRPGSPPLDHLLGFFAEPFNPYGVHFSLRKGRENARAVREALSMEVFVCLNETFRQVDSYAVKDLSDLPAVRAALAATQTGLLGVVGAIEHTLSRDEGWFFLKLGEALERVFRTASVLRTKLPALLDGAPTRELTLYFTQWRSLLRALSSLENYRRRYGAALEPPSVMHFLFFDPHAPRSLRSGAGTVQNYLEFISETTELTPPARAIGKLYARLAYDEGAARIGGAGTVQFLDGILDELTTVHDAVDSQYFGT